MSEGSISGKNIRRLTWPEYGKVIKGTFAQFFQEQSFFHGAALAYYTVFALVPMIYLSLITFGRFVGQHTMLEIIDKILREQIGLTDTSAIMAVMQGLNFEEGNFVMNIVGIIALLLSSSALLASLRTSLNAFLDVDVIFDDRRKQFVHNLRSRGISIIFLPIFGLMLILTYFGQTFVVSFGQDLFNDLGPLQYVLLWLVQHVASIVANILLFAVVFKYLHDGFVSWRLAIAGAFVTSILLYLGQLLIRYYLHNYFFGSSVGVPGTILVLLAWMYYSSQIIFLGAKYMKVHADMVDQSISFRPEKFHTKHLTKHFRRFRSGSEHGPPPQS
jgi:membrane protein